MNSLGTYIKPTMHNAALIHAVGGGRLIEVLSTLPLTIQNRRDFPVGVRVSDLDAPAAKHCLQTNLVGVHHKGESEVFMNSPPIKFTTLSFVLRGAKYVQHQESLFHSMTLWKENICFGIRPKYTPNDVI